MRSRYVRLVVVALALACCAPAQTKLATFAVPPEFPAGTATNGLGYAFAPYPAVSLDLNHDGYDDFVAMDSTAGAVWVVLGGPNGFQPPVSFPVKASGALAAGDFNNDGNPDIVVVGPAIYLLLGTGTGAFQPPIVVSPTLAHRVAAGDFNGDGNLDIAVSGGNNNVVMVALGNGNGTFGSLMTTQLTSPPAWGLFAGDFHNQGRDDLLVVVSRDAFMLTSNGDGTFQVGPVILKDTWGLVAADMNGDGNQDLVTINSVATVRIFFGDGAGGFKLGASTPIESDAFYVAVADVNRDGIPDVVTANQDSSVSIALGKGDGTLQRCYSYKTNAPPVWLGVGRYFASDNADITVLSTFGDRSSNPVLVLLANDGSGHYPGPPNLPFPNAGGFALADMNQDGKLDLVVANSGISSASVSILPGFGNGTFGKAISTIPITGRPVSPVAADFNADGKPDFAVFTGTNIVVGLQGDSNSYQLVTTPAPQPFGSIAWVGDLNGDGFPDLLFNASGSFYVLLGTGNGQFQSPIFVFDSFENSAVVSVADFNHDGKPDLALTVFNTGPAVLLGNGDGTFGPPDYLTDPNAGNLITGDFNNDGNPDILTLVQGISPGFVLFLGDGKGGFQALSQQPCQSPYAQIFTADLNGDGNLDVVSNYVGSVQIFLGDGNGHLTAEPITYLAPAGTQAPALAAGDINNDGKIDLVSESATVSMFINTSR